MKKCIVILLAGVLAYAVRWRILFAVLFLSLMVTSSSSAFDGKRRGFVLGGGLGFAPHANWGRISGIEESKTAFGLNLIIGYAWSEENMIVYEGNVAGYKSDVLNTDIAQGFNGASWYHYFGSQGKAIFTIVGLGLYVFDSDKVPLIDNMGDRIGTQGGTHDPSFGMLVGGGYEFARHVQIGSYLSVGQTNRTRSEAYHHMHINILVSAIAF